ncbi:uncharacterized protein VTP21DRAFT_9418 [Calcarisporiella thermophila]|uniref:uncharacterized protein n=1 Tax=Calcarisporiella thermophila TaxID=911321 RepID=UPI003743FAEC
MNAIKECITYRDFKKLITVCESLEFELAVTTTDNSPPIDRVYAALLAGYMLEHDLCSARFLWKRIPEAIKTASPELTHLWQLGAALWQRDYSAIYQALNGFQWSPEIQPLLLELTERTRQRAFALASNAYSAVNLSDIAAMLGLTPDQTVKALTEKGWIYDSASQVFQPKKIERLPADISMFDQFSRLASMVVHLEKA